MKFAKLNLVSVFLALFMMATSTFAEDDTSVQEESAALQDSLISQDSSSQEPVAQKPARIPFSTLFHNMGWNAVNSLVYGFGLPWAVAAAGTYGMIDSGLDWKWNRFCTRHETMTFIGSLPGGIVGTFAPFFVPFTAYLVSDDRNVQIASAAMGQAALIAVGITTVSKFFTGRVPPHVYDAADGDPRYQKDYSNDWRFGIYEGSIIDGWPSGHTATAVAAVTALSTMYPGNTKILVGSIVYATIIGVSMSFSAHWASDIFAGAITGFMIGRTVGKNFSDFRDGKPESKFQWYVFPTSEGGMAGLAYSF